MRMGVVIKDAFTHTNEEVVLPKRNSVAINGHSLRRKQAGFPKQLIIGLIFRAANMARGQPEKGQDEDFVGATS